MIKNMFFVAIGLLASLSVIAAPASWYLWKSKLNGNVWCTQIPPSDGWLQISGPYKDANCTIHGHPGQR